MTVTDEMQEERLLKRNGEGYSLTEQGVEKLSEGVSG